MGFEEAYYPKQGSEQQTKTMGCLCGSHAKTKLTIKMNEHILAITWAYES